MVRYKLRGYSSDQIEANTIHLGGAFKVLGNGEVYFRAQGFSGNNVNTEGKVFAYNTNTGRLVLFHADDLIVPLDDILIVYSQKEVQHVEA